MKHTRNNVSVDIKSKNKAWVNRLFALGEFIKAHDPAERVTVYAYVDAKIGGLRVSEVSLESGNGGASYMRGDREARNVIACCEDFLSTHGTKPFRPEGWDSFLNEHGESRVALLESMGLDADAAADYAAQLEAEAAA